MTVRNKIILSCLLSLSLITSCQPQITEDKRQTSGRPTVVVSIPPLEYFVKNIGGDKIDVKCLAPTSADPETFEPSIAQLCTASNAKLMLIVGLLPFEEKVTEAIKNSNPEISILALSDSIQFIVGTHNHSKHGHCHEHEHIALHHDSNNDPHIWTSLRNARIIARNTYQSLSRNFPDDSLYFMRNLNILDKRLDSLDIAISHRLENVKGKSFLVWHPSLSYFARDYNLVQLSVGNEHKEFSLTGVKDRIETIRQKHPLVFFYQREFDNRQAQTISSATGLQPFIITPLSSDIEETIVAAADALSSSHTRVELNHASE